MYKHPMQGLEFDHLYSSNDDCEVTVTLKEPMSIKICTPSMKDFTGKPIRVGDPVIGFNGSYLRKGTVISICAEGMFGVMALIQEEGGTETFQCWRDLIMLNEDEKGKQDCLKYHFEGRKDYGD